MNPKRSVTHHTFSVMLVSVKFAKRVMCIEKRYTHIPEWGWYMCISNDFNMLCNLIHIYHQGGRNKVCNPLILLDIHIYTYTVPKGTRICGIQSQGTWLAAMKLPAKQLSA